MKQLRWLTMVAVACLMFATSASAALVVKVAPPKNTGSKAIVKLDLQNTYSEKIQSVRAVMFLLDDQGKVAGQGTRWIIGGSNTKSALEPSARTTYNFVVAIDKPFTKTKLLVTCILLDGGKSGNVQKDVQIQDAPQ